MTSAGIILAAMGVFAVLQESCPASVPSPVQVQGGRVSISASDCPLPEVLLPLCRAADCEWSPDPALTNRLTLTVAGLEPREALFRVLAPFDYVIVWRPGQPALLRLSLPGMPDSTPMAASMESEEPAIVPLPEIVTAAEGEMEPARQSVYEAQVRACIDPQAEPELIRLASRPAGSPLQAEALTALANLGSATATDFLLGCVEGAGPDAEAAFDLVANLALSPRSAAALRFAALGNKRFCTVPTRLAAMRGLSHLNDGGTRAVLETLSHDPDETIRAEAIDLLNEAGGL